MDGGNDPPTPPPLRAIAAAEGDAVSKLDVLLEYVRGLYVQYGALLERLRKGDEQFAEHEREIEALRRKLGRKRPEPHWLLRAAAIGATLAVINVLVHFALRGGFAAGIAG